jgi:hypothetical protein
VYKEIKDGKVIRDGRGLLDIREFREHKAGRDGKA